MLLEHLEKAVSCLLRFRESDFPVCLRRKVDNFLESGIIDCLNRLEHTDHTY